MMLNFVQIPSLGKLCSVIESCRGNVFLQQSDEKFVDMKQSSCLQEELQNTLDQGKNIKLHIFDQNDYQNLLHFMMSTTYE